MYRAWFSRRKKRKRNAAFGKENKTQEELGVGR